MSHYMKFAKDKKHSQNGEDAIIAQLLSEIGSRSDYFVEFGTGNGRDMSNTLALAEKGWRGTWIEQNRESYEVMSEFAKTFEGRVKAFWGTVGFKDDENSLDAFLTRAEAPSLIDVLSIDIDSYDLHVWRAFKNRRARIVVIEINSGVPIGTHQLHDESCTPRKEGSSYSAMMEVARIKGYRLVAHTGNLIFVANECTMKLSQPQSEADNPDSLFNNMWVEWARAAAR